VLLRSPRWDEVTYWALDLETGGLDPRRDAILAVGMVPLRGGVIRLGEAYASLARPEASAAIAPSSVRAHQLVGADLREAPPLSAVLDEIFRRLRGNVLLVHHRAIDEAFLRRAARALGRSWPRPPVVDTAELLGKLSRRRAFLRPEATGEPATLRLADARREHGLPDHPQHDPLSDAIAAAELFLVLRHALAARRLRDLR